jgi:class 3 adenylate cyclase
MQPARHEVSLLIVFVDLTRFEVQGHRVPLAELASTVDAYYELVGEAVAKADGTLVKYIGDAALIVFSPDRADEAVAMLRRLKSAVDALMVKSGWECRLMAKAHLGPVIAGPFGAPDEKHFDVIGATVNAAARLKSTGITVSASVFDQLSHELKSHFASAPNGAFSIIMDTGRGEQA